MRFTAKAAGASGFRRRFARGASLAALALAGSPARPKPRRIMASEASP